MTDMKTFTVIVAANVPTYGRVKVEAASEEDANRIVNESFERDGFASPFWDAADDFDSDWSNCENLRTI